MQPAATNTMSMVAGQAAYQNGDRWLDSVLSYVWNNYVFLKNTFSSELPWAKVIPLEGTFLACPRKTLQEAVKRLMAALKQAQENPPPLEVMTIPIYSSTCCGG